MFVGNIPPETEVRDLRDFFRDYGVINDCWVARKPPGFGFVWFDSERDAVYPYPLLISSHRFSRRNIPRHPAAIHDLGRRMDSSICRTVTPETARHSSPWLCPAIFDRRSSPSSIRRYFPSLRAPAPCHHSTARSKGKHLFTDSSYCIRSRKINYMYPVEKYLRVGWY